MTPLEKIWVGPAFARPCSACGRDVSVSWASANAATLRYVVIPHIVAVLVWLAADALLRANAPASWMTTAEALLLPTAIVVDGFRAMCARWVQIPLEGRDRRRTGRG
jgi:uncharacterized protein (DUF983 family)